MFGLAHQLAVEQLQKLDSRYRLIVVHPQYLQQHLTLPAVLDGQQPALYLRFDGRNLTTGMAQAQFEAALQAQIGQAHLGDTRLVILDECDNVQSDDLASFVAQLYEQLTNGRLILLTRCLPHTLMANETLRSQMIFLPVDESLMLWNYAHRAADKKVLLEVRALGAGSVMRNGVIVDTWDGVLPRSLFFFLVDRGMTTRNDIFQTFWPNLSVREATNVFHVTKRKISEVLGTDLTVYWSGFYRIAPDIELSYDVVRFSELYQDSAIASVERGVEMLRRATALYRTDFLTTLDMPWVLERRAEMRQLYGETLIALAKAREQQGAYDEALGLFLRAMRTNPHREDVVHSIMKLYHRMEMPNDALQVYYRLKDELAERLGVDPDNYLQELAGELERIAIPETRADR
jgi:two-component SAPR family response regulator